MRWSRRRERDCGPFGNGRVHWQNGDAPEAIILDNVRVPPQHTYVAILAPGSTPRVLNQPVVGAVVVPEPHHEHGVVEAVDVIAVVIAVVRSRAVVKDARLVELKGASRVDANRYRLLSNSRA